MSTYPKSPQEMTSGMMWFPRMLDKIRLHDRGELGEDYLENLGGGLDKRCATFLRVEYSDLRRRALEGGTDEEILQWSFAKGRALNEVDLMVWNAYVSKLGWNDQATKRLAELKEMFGAADRSDIMTIPDLLDLDEKRRS